MFKSLRQELAEAEAYMSELRRKENEKLRSDESVSRLSGDGTEAPQVLSDGKNIHDDERR